MEEKRVFHPIPPLYDENSTVLILGSFPSVKSRETAFFYGHPQNRFWKVTAGVFGCPVPETVAQKRAFLQDHHIALWDVIASCTIAGSADSSIQDVVPNDLTAILRASRVRRVFVNGKTASRYYQKYLQSQTGIEAICLPSTSPANASWSVARLIDTWKIILE